MRHSALRRFLWGSVGAAAPEVIRLYKAFASDVGQLPSLPHFSSVYLLVSLAFIVFGGLFACAWGDNHPMRCIYVGLSFPLIVSSSLKLPPPPPPP